MRVFERKLKWNNNTFNNYLNFDYNLGESSNKLLVGYDYFRQELLPGGSQMEARSYLIQNGTATNVLNSANAADYVLDADGNPVCLMSTILTLPRRLEMVLGT